MENRFFSFTEKAVVLNITTIRDSSDSSVDYHYKFMFIDVGCQRRISDGGVYNNSSLSNATENNLLDLPPPRPLPFSEDPEWVHDYETERFPVVIVVDDAFPLKPQIIKPYSHRNLTFPKICRSVLCKITVYLLYF